jgi:hypothetical protein
MERVQSQWKESPVATFKTRTNQRKNRTNFTTNQIFYLKVKIRKDRESQNSGNVSDLFSGGTGTESWKKYQYTQLSFIQGLQTNSERAEDNIVSFCITFLHYLWVDERRMTIILFKCLQHNYAIR